MNYGEWVKYHCDFFAFKDASDAKAMMEWQDLIEAENHGDYDLADLTRQLAKEDYPSFARDHLKAILALIRRRRAESFQGERSDGSTHPDFGVCATCESTGRVTVPHLRCIVDGRWVPRIVARGSRGMFYTMSVLCHCRLGSWFAERLGTDRDKKPRVQMTILEYARRNPDWQRQIAERAAIDAEEARLSADPKQGVQKSLDRLRERMASAWMMPVGVQP